MRYRKSIWLLTLLCSLCMLTMVEFSQGATLTDGVNWLAADQDVSGFWGTDKNSPYRDAAVVVEILSRMNADPTAIADGLNALYNQTTTSTDYLARKIIALAAAESDIAPDDLADSLAGLQNEDGGWGYGPGYESNILETALALAALKAAVYATATTLEDGVNYLKTEQNIDGGWPFVPDDTSRIFYTAHAMLALALFADEFSVATQMADGVSWLSTEANFDGGFGTGGGSNPFETGLALAAISEVDPAETAAVNAYNYLSTSQLPNGSWNNDAYFTARALHGMANYQGLQSRSVPLVTHLNLLGLPVEPLDPLTSPELLSQILGCTAITGWNRAGQSWLTGSFPVEMQDGFFASMSSVGQMIVLGQVLGENQCTTLEPGLNIISIPNENACYTGFSLVDDITDCVEAHQWNQESQSWSTAVVIDSDTLVGDDFSVASGNGYFVRVSSGGSWCTQTCDTVTPPNLPDLRITAADFYINPNPAQTGILVEIYVNMDNIGTDTAYAPRLTFFQGDPGAGGSMLMDDNLPVDVPPGESSGYWGRDDFTFGSPGSVEIYAVADYYDAILELDEGNNQDHTTLAITSSMEASPGLLTDDDKYTTKAQLVAGTSLPGQSFQRLVAGGMSPSGVDGTEATTIKYIQVNNITSSSATITWVTNEFVDACVSYGVSDPSEHMTCLGGPGGWAHLVELTGLSAATTYVFDVVTGGIIADNGGLHYSFTTTSAGAGAPSVIYGQVVDTNATPTPGVVVSATVEHAGSMSYPLAALAAADGTWILNLGNLKNSATDDVLPYSPGDQVFIAASGGVEGTGSDTITVSGSSPQDAGTLILSGCDCGAPWGDVSGDGMVNPVDVVVMVNYAYLVNDIRALLPDCPREAGDVNCDGILNPVDVVFYINRVYLVNDMFCPDPCSP